VHPEGESAPLSPQGDNRHWAWELGAVFNYLLFSGLGGFCMVLTTKRRSLIINWGNRVHPSKSWLRLCHNEWSRSSVLSSRCSRREEPKQMETAKLRMGGIIVDPWLTGRHVLWQLGFDASGLKACHTPPTMATEVNWDWEA